MRTCHMFTLLAVEPGAEGVRARTSWTLLSFRENATTTY
jgi:hypothetical protein